LQIPYYRISSSAPSVLNHFDRGLRQPCIQNAKGKSQRLSNIVNINQCLHDYQRSRHTAGSRPPLQYPSSHFCCHFSKLEMLQFLPHYPTIQGPTTSVFDAVEVHRQARARHQDVVIRVKSSMVKCQRDSKVVRRRKRLFMERGDLRTSMVTLDHFF
jgi:hypothetical protein